jgi:serine/threonine protein kinase
VKLLGVFEDALTVSMILECCEGGDLLDLVRTRVRRGHHPDEAVANAAQRQLLEALAFLHGIGIVHRDVKCENILQLERRGSVAPAKATFKLADFGLAVRVLPGERLHDRQGTILSLAPEVFEAEAYCGKAADAWAAGTVLFTMLAGWRPQMAEYPATLHDLSHAAERPSAGAMHLLSLLLRIDPDQRASAKEALAHDWISASAPRQ